jgi:hypothetical protein
VIGQKRNLYEEEPVEIDTGAGGDTYVPSYDAGNTYEPKEETYQPKQESSSKKETSSASASGTSALISEMKKMKVEDVNQLEDAAEDIEDDPKLK